MLPLILENVLMMLSSVILTSFIGRLEVDEITAYGMATRVVTIFFALFRGMGTGVMIIAAKEYGAGRKSRCRWIQHEAYVSVLPLAALICIWIFFNSRLVLSVMTSDAALLDRSEGVLRLISVFLILQALLGLNTAAFQAFGNTRTPMIIAAIGNLVSVVCGFFLISGVGSFSGFGLMGAAWSLVLSWLVMAVLGLVLIYGPNGLYAEVPADHAGRAVPDRQDVKQIYQIGVPVALENSFWSVATVYISRVILLYGSTVYASYQLGLQAEGLCDVVSAGFLTGSMTLAAMAAGAEDEDLYSRYYRRLNFFCLMVCFLTMAFLAFLSRPILHFLTDKEELVEIAYGYLFAMVFSQIPQHMTRVLSGFIRPAGHPQAPTVISFAGIVLRVVLVVLVGQVLHLSITWVWWCFNADLWFRYLASLIFARKHRIREYVSDLKKARAESCAQ